MLIRVLSIIEYISVVEFSFILSMILTFVSILARCLVAHVFC